MMSIFTNALLIRHNQGLYNLACDIEACLHYGISDQEPGMPAWRIRRYVAGFLGLN